MISLLLGLVLLSWIFGRNRGLIGGLAGGFVGAFVLAGMVRTAGSGELAALYTPDELASSVLPVTLVGALAALIAPYAAAVVTLAWGAGALLAAVAALPTNEATYAPPLILHGVGAACVVYVARARTAQLKRGQPSPHRRTAELSYPGYQDFRIPDKRGTRGALAAVEGLGMGRGSGFWRCLVATR